jgi:RND family efflux transporter MFP subunit
MSLAHPCKSERRSRRLAALLMTVVTLGAVACAGERAGEEISSDAIPTITADVSTVSRGTIVEPLVVRGTIVALPNQDVKIAALVAGRLDRLNVAEGDTVRAGQVIAEIDPRPFGDRQRQAAAELAQAQAAAENARLNLDRTTRLHQRGIAAGKEVEDAKTQVAAAESAVEQARVGVETADRDLSRAHVTSPISGQVVKRLVSVGEPVDGTAAQPLVEVANLDQVEVAAEIPAGQLAQVATGQSVDIISTTYADRTFVGKVVAIAPAVDPATDAALARVRLANPGRLLKSGMFVQARIGLSRHENAVIVPPAAVVRGEDASAVYVVTGDMAVRTAVTTGIQTDSAVEILSGLRGGERIVASGVHGLGERARLAASK